MGTPPPLLDLPTELLVEIFTQSNNPQISLICCDFRDIVNSTPSFWTFVYIGPKQCIPGAPEFLSRRLQRSATCLLDVIIRDTEPSTALATELWQKVSNHRDRIRAFDIGADTWLLCGQILYTILLTSSPSTLPSLAKLDIRHEDDLSAPAERAPMEPHTLLRPIGSLFQGLTTLVLPLMDPCIPFPDSPMLSLKTLVLDGSMSWMCDHPGILDIAYLLSCAPELETFWCKDHRVYTFTNLSILSAHPPPDDGPPVHCPITLRKLTKMALIMPGFGYDLLHAINAPALQDLHMDGIRCDYMFEQGAAWLTYFLDRLRTGLQIAASRSPELRRLSLVGAYLSRDTWEWLLGCSASTRDLPFPLLESIAVHQMKAVKDQVTNAVDDALIELYAQRGQLKLLRLAYLASEPPLGSVALQQLINSVSEKQRPSQIFELELDGAYDLDIKVGVRLILHEERPQRPSWWTLGKDIDPTEDDSF